MATRRDGRVGAGDAGRAGGRGDRRGGAGRAGGGPAAGQAPGAASGRWPGGSGAHQRFLLAQQLAHIDFLDEQIAAAGRRDRRERTRPFEDAVGAAGHHPGRGPATAEVAGGRGRRRRWTASRRPGHLASWAGMCPGNDESAGKRRSGRTRKGSPSLRRALVEAAHAAGADQDDLPGRPVPPPGRPAGREAGGRRGRPHHPGHRLPPARPRDRLPGPRPRPTSTSATATPSSRRLVGRLEKLGYKVTIEPRRRLTAPPQNGGCHREHFQTSDGTATRTCIGGVRNTRPDEAPHHPAPRLQSGGARRPPAPALGDGQGAGPPTTPDAGPAPGRGVWRPVRAGAPDAADASTPRCSIARVKASPVTRRARPR